MAAGYHAEGAEIVTVRLFNAVGPRQSGQYGMVVPRFVHQALVGEELTVHGDGEQTRDLVAVEDVAEANYRAAAAKGVSGAFNIGSGSRISINDLVRTLSEVSGVSPRVFHGPPRAGDVRHSIADISLAHEKLGYTPTVNLVDGLRRYWRWAGAAGV